MIKLLFIMLMSHCFADTVFQSDRMAKGKNRHKKVDLSQVPKGQKPLNLWGMWLTHHAVIQGGTLSIFLILFGFINYWWIGIIETITHWIIDFYKCENLYNPYVDQLLHLLIKFVYVIIIVRGLI